MTYYKVMLLLFSFYECALFPRDVTSLSPKCNLQNREGGSLEGQVIFIYSFFFNIQYALLDNIQMNPLGSSGSYALEFN